MNSTTATIIPLQARQDRDRNPLGNELSFARYVIGNSFALLFGLAVAYLALLHNHSITESTIKTGDFIAYYSGSHLVVAGHGANLYNLHDLGQLQTALLRPLIAPNGILMPYLYPPYLSLLLAPIAALPFNAAYAVWLLINGVLLVSSLYLLERYTGLTGRAGALVRLATICSLPVLMALFNGQTSILILALLTVAFFAERSNRSILAGIALAFAMIKLPYVLPLILVFASLRRWRVLVSFAATAAALFALPVAVLGLSINSSYARTLVEATGWHDQFGYSATRNESIAGFCQLLFSPGTASALRLVLCLGAVAGLLWCCRRSSGIDLPFGLGIVVALLISPHVLAHDLVLLILPVAVALHYRHRGPMHLKSLLVAGYMAVTLGYWVAFVEPVQLSVAAMCGLGVWLLLAGERVWFRPARVAIVPFAQPFAGDPPA